MQPRFLFLAMHHASKEATLLHSSQFCFLCRVTKIQKEMKKFVLMSRKGKSFVDQPAVSWGMRNENRCSGEGGGLDDTKLRSRWN